MAFEATITFYRKWASVKCPNGHSVAMIRFDHGYAGSRAESELGQHQFDGQSIYDRLAAQCAHHDSEQPNDQ